MEHKIKTQKVILSGDDFNDLQSHIEKLEKKALAYDENEVFVEALLKKLQEHGVRIDTSGLQDKTEPINVEVIVVQSSSIVPQINLIIANPRKR